MQRSRLDCGGCILELSRKWRTTVKVEDARRKEQSLVEWEDAIAYREYKLENREDDIVSLMRELKLKEVLLLEKTAEVTKYKRQAEDAVREARADERRFEEVCRICILCVIVKRGGTMTDTKFVSVCVTGV